jgi:hypothetical protein
MSIYKNVKSLKATNAHGEVNFLKITGGSVDVKTLEPFEPENGVFIVGHSESGHNHVLDRVGVQMYQGIEKGMKVLYAIVNEPVSLKQSAGTPHAEQVVTPGQYIITNNADYDPFTQQARRVAD